MAEYLLDTDISSYIMKRSHEAVLRRLQTVPIGAVAISVITKSDLLYGVEVSPGDNRTHWRSANICVTLRSWIFRMKLPCTTHKFAQPSRRAAR